MFRLTPLMFRRFFRLIKNDFIYRAVKLFFFILGLIPSGFVSTLGRGLGNLAYLIASSERKTAGRQLDRVYESRLSVDRCKLLVRGVFCRLGVSVVELARVARNLSCRPTVLISESSRQVLNCALSHNRGVIFVTAHLGNWELMAVSLAQEGYAINTVAKESYDSRFTKMIDDKRISLGVKSIYRGGKGAAAAMLRALRKNEILGLLIDQDTSVPSVFVPFLGSNAKTPSAPAVLSLRTGAPIVIGAINRNTGNGIHRIEILPFESSNTVEDITERLNDVLTLLIKKHPCDWVWFHKRWKSADQRNSLS